MFKQLIYASRPFGFDDLTLFQILDTARRYNERHEITGALICREDIYLQMLEGPAQAVDTVYQRIAQDDRHVEVEHLWSGDVDARMFPAWAMRDDPARSWMWTAEQVSAGIVTKAPVDEVRGVFLRLASEPASPKCAAMA